MSINSAMLAGVSGLVANSSALAAVSDNIANVNTTAYKRSQVNFGSVVTAQMAGRYSAGGVQGSTRQFISQQGLVQAATSPTDLAISGDGFFVTTQKATNLTSGDARLFTRSGSFTVDADGYLMNDARLFLQGWPIQANGTFDINPSDIGKLAPINVRGLTSAVAPTSEISVGANLYKDQPVSAGAATWDTTTNSMAQYAIDGTGTRPDFTIELNVVDSTGGNRKLAMAFLRDDGGATPPIANQWRAEIYAIPATDVESNVGAPGLLKHGYVRFDNNGRLDMSATGTDLFGTPADPRIILDASGTATPVRWADGLGIAAQTVELDLAKLQQMSMPSTVTQVTSNGAGVGNVVGVQVDAEGVVTAVFDNSQVRKIAKIAIATFPNADGLTAVSGNAYRASGKSGGYLLKEPGVGAGQISPQSLEASTVDLSAEFTGLIQTQKAYSASSRIITTADQMLEELINIKR
ncbi:flagellar hook-basal body complex protein [Phenylobacterium sp.]|jgi:flagellar hook protein FlgE|uniref:flagellar hook protein FlgE n=1 Tax=Phenylobacterium sp. TaxID=1871053 RepID=UPI002F93CAD5